jgi:hypothetical protein
MDEVATSPTGLETIDHVMKQWDADSKTALAKEPQLLEVIHEQRENGIYGRIAGEIDRQKMLGNLKGVPFIQAYRMVGDALQEKGLLVPASAAKPTEAKPEVTPVGSTVVLPKAPAANGEKARAAAPSRSTKQQTTPAADVNFLNESDEAFLKRMENRV